MNIGKTSPFQSTLPPFKLFTVHIYYTSVDWKRDSIVICLRIASFRGKNTKNWQTLQFFAFFPRYLPPEKIFESFSFDRII